MAKRPNTRTNLDKAIQRLYGQTIKFVNIRSLMANAIIGQFLPGAVAKGGSALKLRFGDMATRMTTDFDIAYKDTVESVIADLAAGLRIGWNGFDGEVVAQKPMSPKGVREAYVMKPYSVKLRYNKAPWCTVQLEVAFNEIGDADVADIEISEEITKVFESLGFPAPAPVSAIAAVTKAKISKGTMKDKTEAKTALKVVNILTNHKGTNCPKAIPKAVITTTATIKLEEKK